MLMSGINWILDKFFTKPTLAELPIEQKYIALNMMNNNSKTYTLGR
jgi:hypothetical protein